MPTSCQRKPSLWNVWLLARLLYSYKIFHHFWLANILLFCSWLWERPWIRPSRLLNLETWTSSPWSCLITHFHYHLGFFFLFPSTRWIICIKREFLSLFPVNGKWFMSSENKMVGALYLCRPLLRLPSFWMVMTLSGLLGLAISFTSMWFLHQTGATTYR